MNTKIAHRLPIIARLVLTAVLVLMIASPSWAAQALPSAGLSVTNQPLLVVGINLSGVPELLLSDEADLAKFAFDADTDEIETTSLADYYAEASYGQFNLVPAAEIYDEDNNGVIIIDLDTWDHYPLKPATPDDPNEIQDFVEDALVKVDEFVQFDTFDTNENEFISFDELRILFIVAGYDKRYCDYTGETCPAHNLTGDVSNQLEDGVVSPLYDGVTVGRLLFEPGSDLPTEFGGYFLFAEQHGVLNGTDDHIATIGPIVYEIGTTLPWPNLFVDDDVVDGVIEAGAGEWSLMGTGYWNSTTVPGDSPALPDAFLKFYQGWLAPVHVANSATIPLRPSAANPDALMIGASLARPDWQFVREVGWKEYWLVENRQKTGYDAGLPGCGILIWHIDETRSSIYPNADSSRPLVALEQADGLNELALDVQNYPAWNNVIGDPGDPFGTTGTSLSWGPGPAGAHTNPSSNFYNGANPRRHRLTIQETTCGAVNTPSILVSYSGLDMSIFMPMIRKP